MLFTYSTLLFGLMATISSAIPLNTVESQKRSITVAPVMGGINFPDPSLIRTANGFSAFATNGKVDGKLVHVQYAHSPDFETWTHGGTYDALPKLPAWVDAASPRVWAPDVVQVNDGSFVLYYTAANKATPALHCLGVATASSVKGPYKPVSDQPWACPLAQGGAIDPAGYVDKQGRRWVTYKIDGNAIGHGGSCSNSVAPIVPTPIVLQQVGADGHTKIGGVSSPLITNGKLDGPVVEAPSLSQMSDGTFVLFFSSNCFATPLYDVSYATASNIEGPYTKYGPMFVTGTSGLTAPGGLDIAVNGNHAVFHANHPGGRAMYTAIISGAKNSWHADTTAGVRISM